MASGTDWAKKTKKSTGGFEIVDVDGAFLIRFAGSFKPAKPPEPLRILWSTRSPNAAANKNAEAVAVLIATLKAVKGTQEYRVAEGIDPAKYRSILLNCRKYTKLWSAGSLEKRKP